MVFLSVLSAAFACAWGAEVGCVLTDRKQGGPLLQNPNMSPMRMFLVDLSGVYGCVALSVP